MLQQLSIARRTTLVLGFMVLAMLTTASLSLVTLTAVSKQIEEIAGAQVERIALSQRWDANIREAVARWGAVSLVPDAGLFNSTKEKTLAISTDTTRVQKRFSEIENSPEGLALGKELGAARALWLAERDKVRAAIESGDQATATALGTGSFAKISEDYLAVSARHAAYQVDRAKTFAATAIATAEQQLRWLMGVTVLSVLAAVGLGVAFARSLVHPLVYAARVADRIAGGDLSESIQVKGKDESARMLTSLQSMQARLRELVGQISATSESIGTASAEIASGNQDLSARTEQAASNLEETAASMEELTSTVRNSADAARQANQLAASASEVAVRGGQVVSQVVSTMQDIHQSSQKINDIIGTIDGIAFQTNILALNAAVEAARAGEQGRGFAVVAGEVRNLAQRSAEAAKEIKGLIGASVDKVETGSRLVADAGQTMSEIVGSIQRVSDIVGEITAAAGEQSDGIGQVNTAVNQLDQMTQQNAALVEESAAAAESLKDQAARLTQVVSVFRIDANASGLKAVSTLMASQAAPLRHSPAKALGSPGPKAHKPITTHAPRPTASRAAAPVAPAATASAAPRNIPVPASAEGDWESF